MTTRVAITGGAGFIGSHLVDACVARGFQVSVIDNLSVGHFEHIEAHVQTGSVDFIRGDVLDPYLLRSALSGADLVVHLAANPDARLGLENPSIDLELEVISTFQVLEAMRRLGLQRIILASSGTVYGDVGPIAIDERYGPCQPISLYAAGKAAAEAFISAYCSSFGMRGLICRFGNVIGERATHGALFDFVRKLELDSSQLQVLGNGRQAKPYIEVRDLVQGLLFLAERAVGPYDVFNIAPEGATSVATLAQTLLDELGLSETTIRFGKSEAGWLGDVPQSRMDASKLKRLGWTPRYSSDDAVRSGVRDLVQSLDLRGRIRGC
ncbi:MAG: NAD-dependent epimerase/dehydratase family protein [Chloroflexota bacterium]